LLDPLALDATTESRNGELRLSERQNHLGAGRGRMSKRATLPRRRHGDMLADTNLTT
jgi:hypothetical protein